MSEAGIEPRIVHRAPVAWLTTLRVDGSPHTTAVWFAFADERFWIGAAMSSTKVANMAVDPRVSLAIDGSSARPIVAEGLARMHSMASLTDEVAAEFAEKYDGWDVADESVDGERRLIEVVVTRWLRAG